MPGVATTPLARGKTELAPRWRLDAKDYVAAMDITRDGRWCAIATGSGEVLVVDVDTGAVRSRAMAHPQGALEVAFARDGATFITCGQDASAKLFATSGALLRELPGGSAWVEHAAWSPSGDRLATASGRRVRFWTPAGEPVVETEPLPSTVTAIAWDRKGTQLAAICYGGVYILGATVAAKTRHLAWKGSLISLAWSPDGKVIACGSQDNSVHFWRLATGEDSEMRGYPFKPRALEWDGQSSLLATAGDAAVCVWDFAGKGPEGSTPIQLEGHKAVCTRLAFSPRKGVLASGAQDTSVLLWEPRRGTKPIRYAFLEDEITALRWHPEHRGLLGGDAAGNVVYWNIS